MADQAFNGETVSRQALKLGGDERYGLCVIANKDLFVEKDALSSLLSASLGKHKEPICQLAPRAGARREPSCSGPLRDGP